MMSKATACYWKEVIITAAEPQMAREDRYLATVNDLNNAFNGVAFVKDGTCTGIVDGNGYGSLLDIRDRYLDPI
jgi:hypothetical protein